MTYDLPPTSSGYGQQSGNGGVRDQARNVGSEAAQAGGNVAQSAKEQGREVVGEASRQARNLYGEARTQLAGQANTQQRRAAGGLRSLADEMRSMADQGGQSGPMSEIARQAADRVHGVAGWLEDREPGDLVAEVRNYARRNPATFLIGAAVLGVVAGRLTRNVAAVSSNDSTGSSGGYQAAYSRPVSDPDSTVVLPPSQPSGYADSLSSGTQTSTYAGSGYGETAEPTRYAGSGYGETAEPTTYAGSGYGETAEPTTYTSSGYGEPTQPTTYTGSGYEPTQPSGYDEPLPPAGETDPLPGVPSRGARS